MMDFRPQSEFGLLAAVMNATYLREYVSMQI